ncbi:MAG TPA: hypothetical protein VFB28_07245 [Terriglobales bacterium]|nr:hypothetical protein [Terriglobales bacterium]
MVKIFKMRHDKPELADKIADGFRLPVQGIQWSERPDHEGVNNGKLARWLSLADQALDVRQPSRRRA